MLKILSAPHRWVAVMSLVACASSGVSAQGSADPWSPRLALVERMLSGGDYDNLDEGRVLDLKTQIEGLPFVARGDRKPARAANAQGLKALEASHYQAAAAHFERAAKLDPADQEICNNLAFAYFRAGQMEHAWTAIKRTLALAPARTSAWANIGQMRAAQGKQTLSVWSFKNSYRFSRKPDVTRMFFDKLKNETQDDTLQSALASTLAAIDSGAIANLVEHPQPIGASPHAVQVYSANDPPASEQEEALHLTYDRVRKGDKAAFAIIQNAGNEGQRLAQTMLGEAYLRGYAVVEDAALSAVWFRRAADQGHRLAKYQLALAYQEGRGVARDYNSAALWYGEAAAQGDRDAMNNLGAIYDRGQIGKADPVSAAKLYRQASDLGNPQASYNLAIAYAEGQGVTRDLSESARLYLLSAEGGFVQAQVQVAYNYDEGNGVARDEAKALFWYRKAAAAGIEFAREVLKRKGAAE